nr:hypothetical protein DRB99_07585 [Clostridium butyricum]
MQEIKIPATLSVNNLIFLFIYYTVLLLVSSLITIHLIYTHYLSLSVNVNYTIGFNKILITCISFSICSSCIYYIRKLYKLSLANKIYISSNNNDKLRKLGTISYFLIRPWFSGVFSIVMFLGLNSGILIVSGTNIPYNRLMDLYIFLSFFVGFSSGKFIQFIETKSDDIINSFNSPKIE